MAASGSAAIPFSMVAALDALTVVRTWGELLLQLLSADTAGINGAGFRVAAGICIVTQNAAGIGITAIPTPIADIGWDGWLWYWTGGLSFGDLTAGSEGKQLGGFVRVVIDSKAMRKIRITDNLVAVIEVVETGVATMVASLESRVLVKLP